MSMILVAGIVAANPQSSAARATWNGMPTVHLAGSGFATNVVLDPKGTQLPVADGSLEPIIGNGAWPASDPPQAHAGPGAPAVHNVDIKGGSAQIGPFATAGSFTATARSTAA